ncbi:hypothetical protein PYCCODRAFT_1369498 [Trametes coccinea BRFM310]|uniref:Required for respiratory growth protein 9, mitochondrial n=1 Tax=Trametes coccinea (strain BRFM310) TaxID=1353009 RepID=A0A1Y2ILI3_TRAC3|nr:hypothetical protein PYCCODRAFT_1369498 [Trametes coccinea BRFM310]
MLSALRSFRSQTICTRRTHINLYTTVAELTRSHWKTGAHPAPQSGFDHEYEQSEGEASTSTRPRSHTPFPHKPELKPTPPEYRAHRETMKRKFPQGWEPPRKISREAMDSLRELHALNPSMFTTPVLAERFRISKEAVRRILKSKWEPSREQRARLAAKERMAKAEWKLLKRQEERHKHEKIQEELGIVPEERKDDRLSLT